MKVLLGIGGSEDSFKALEQTLRRAEEAGDRVTVAIVENPESDVPPAEIEERVSDRIADTDLAVAVRRVEGDPGARLVDIAESEDFDAVALGGGSQSPMGKIRLGHIAEFVILNTTTSVILHR